METAAVSLFFALFACASAQYMSTWGTSSGYGNQMQMGMPYGHMPMHHWRDASGGDVSLTLNPKLSEAVVPIQILRGRMPSRMGLQDYSLMNVNAPDHDESAMDHVIYKQTMGEMKRPVVDILSLLVPPMSMQSATKSTPGYQDQMADAMMTCVGMDDPPMKVHSSDPRIIINRGIPYYMQTMHKIKV